MTDIIANSLMIGAGVTLAIVGVIVLLVGLRWFFLPYHEPQENDRSRLILENLKKVF